MTAENLEQTAVEPPNMEALHEGENEEEDLSEEENPPDLNTKNFMVKGSYHEE